MVNGTDDSGEHSGDSGRESASRRNAGFLRKVHKWALAAGLALALVLLIAALVHVRDMWISSLSGQRLASPWFIIHVCSIGAVCIAVVSGMALFFRRGPEADTPNLPMLATYGLAILTLTFQLMYLPDFWRYLIILFWPTEEWLLRWGVFLTVIFVFVFLPMLCHILIRRRRSGALFDTALMVVLAILTVDALSVRANGYSRESLVSLALMKYWSHYPITTAALVLVPWLLGGWVLSTRERHSAYLVSAATVLGACVFVYGVFGRLWWCLAR